MVWRVLARNIWRSIWRPVTDPLANVVAPGPPGPLDRLIPEADGLDNYSTPYTNTNTVIHIRCAYITAEAGVPDFTVAIDGEPCTLIANDHPGMAGSVGVFAYYLDPVSPGGHTIDISASGASCGRAALRIGELVSQTGIGAVGGAIQTNPSYYIEGNAGTTAGPGQVGTIAAFNNQSAADITASYSDTEQWAGWQTGLAFRFATGDRPSGESTPGLFVFYSANAGVYDGNCLIYEIIDGVLPP